MSTYRRRYTSAARPLDDAEYLGYGQYHPPRQVFQGPWVLLVSHEGFVLYRSLPRWKFAPPRNSILRPPTLYRPHLNVSWVKLVAVDNKNVARTYRANMQDAYFLSKRG